MTTDCKTIATRQPMTAGTAAHKCHFCKLYRANNKLPKTYDFSMKHAYHRYGITEHVEEVMFQKVHVYDMEWQELVRLHPDWMVTDWLWVCDDCLPYVHRSPESENRLFGFLEKHIGKEAMDETVEKVVRANIVPIFDAVIEAQRERERQEKRRLRQPSGFYSGVAQNG